MGCKVTPVRNLTVFPKMVCTYMIIVFIVQGETMQQFKLEVLKDTKPEMEEEFTVRLQSVKSTGIFPSGAATINRIASEAFILVGANNDPHGFLAFAVLEQPLRIEENQGYLELSVIRKFGDTGMSALHSFSFLTLPVPIPDEGKKLTETFIFALLCGVSKDFMKALKAFIKPFEAPQRSVQIKM